MKKIIFKTILFFTVILVLVPRSVFAADLLMGLINVTPMTGDFIVTVQLQPVEINSFSGYTLLGFADPDDMDPPIAQVNNLPINVNGGYINTTMMLPDDPTGYAFQYCLVNNTYLASQGGMNLYNPNNPNNSDYQICSGLSWYLSNGQGGNNGEGNTAEYQFQSGNALLVISGDLTLNNGYALITINSLDGEELAAADVSTNGSGVFSHTFGGLSSSGIVPGQQYTFTIVNSDNTDQVFLTNQPINFPGGQGGNDNPPDDFNPAQDCYEEAFADTQPCIDFFASGGDYNSNLSFTSSLQNPLGENGDIDIVAFLQKLFKVMVKIALPFLILFAIYSGFLFVEARGNTDKLEVAKKNFLYVIIGAFIIFGAWMIATVLKGTIDDISAMNTIIKEIIKLT